MWKNENTNFNYRLRINLANTNSLQMLPPTNLFQVHVKKQCSLVDYQKKKKHWGSVFFHFALECQTICEPKRWNIGNAIHHFLCACSYIICAATFFFKVHRIDK